MINQIYRVFILLGNFNKTVTVPAISSTLPHKFCCSDCWSLCLSRTWVLPCWQQSSCFSFQATANRASHSYCHWFLANAQVLVVFSSLLIFYSYSLHFFVSSCYFIWQEQQKIPNNGSLKQKFPTFQCSQGRKLMGATNNSFSQMFNIMGLPISRRKRGSIKINSWSLWKGTPVEERKREGKHRKISSKL